MQKSSLRGERPWFRPGNGNRPTALGEGREGEGVSSVYGGSLVPVEGVEPPWAEAHLILSQARLPFRHTGARTQYNGRQEAMSRRCLGRSKRLISRAGGCR